MFKMLISSVFPLFFRHLVAVLTVSHCIFAVFPLFFGDGGGLISSFWIFFPFSRLDFFLKNKIITDFFVCLDYF
tara:strand:- start:212 stop:433 length:222 start_codon:yes stop_codon:yes gene_type:complete